MGKTQQKPWRQVSVDDFKNILELLADEMIEMDDASVLLKKSGDQVFVYFPKRYHDEVDEILEESKREFQQKQDQGYSQEQAFQDFMEAEQEISKYISETKP
ncbi:MAG: hypothetical protein ACE5I1_24480 [bacterium]